MFEAAGFEPVFGIDLTGSGGGPVGAGGVFLPRRRGGVVHSAGGSGRFPAVKGGRK